MNETFYRTATASELMEYLAGKPDINAVGEGDMAPVHWFAACNPHLDVMQGVLGAGGDVHARTSSGFTALHAAAAYNENADIVRCLLENKSAVNSRNENGLTPLHGAAAFNANPDVITVLIEGNARVDSSSARSMTPLLAAAALAGTAAVIKALVESGADVNEQNEDQETPLHLAAAFNRNVEIVEALVEHGADINAVSRDGFTPLHYAALNHAKTDIVELLLARGADPRVRDGNGKTARDLAGESLRPLLKANGSRQKKPASDPEEAAEFGTNQYFTHATADAVRKDLGEGARADVIEKAQGLSILSRAARYTQDGGVPEVLIEHGADISSTDNNGNTALHWATKNKHIANEVISVLLKHGADVSVQNKRGVLPVEMAARNTNDSAVVQTLLEKGQGLPSGDEALALFRAALTNVRTRKQHFQVLLGMGLDINTTDKSGNTILHQNVRSKNWTLGA
ncbi:MAG: ankyrin repeat domain-containing protein, partial [Rhodobacteraceae bacterium]|nr:ankyrin repeat domain-containing protein [Paracoccaceae bacterium]